MLFENVFGMTVAELWPISSHNSHVFVCVCVRVGGGGGGGVAA